MQFLKIKTIHRERHRTSTKTHLERKMKVAEYVLSNTIHHMHTHTHSQLWHIFSKNAQIIIDCNDTVIQSCCLNTDVARWV